MTFRPLQRHVFGLGVGAVFCATASQPRIAHSLDDVSLQQANVTLYQFESCPFCRKARSVLDFGKVPYRVVEVNPLAKTELQSVAPDYKKVPVLTVDSADGSVQIRDSKAIVQAVMTALGTGSQAGPKRRPPVIPATAAMWPPKESTASPPCLDSLSDIEREWILWTDKVLVQLIVVNIYRNLSEASETFEYLLTHPEFTTFWKYAGHASGTAVMTAVALIRKRKFQLSDERQALYDTLDAFVDSLEGDFLGGEKPCRADFNVYGILRSVQSFTTETDMFANSKIGGWYDRMQTLVGPSCALNTVARGPQA